MRNISRIVLIVLLGLLPRFAEARLFRVWTTEDLLPVSRVICNGTVTKLEKLSEDKLPPDSFLSATHWKAHIKVLSVYKGYAPGEIDLFYTEKFSDFDGPINFTLKEGERYRFYLNPSSDGTYVTALDTNIDNLWAVQSLYPGEPDNSPPLFQKEANELALAFYKLHQPEASNPAPEQSAKRTFDNDWRVSFWFKKEKGQDFDPDAEVGVRSDRTISLDSWIAEPRKAAQEIVPKDIARDCWVLLEPDLKDSLRTRTKLWGKIQSVTSTAVLLTDVHDRRNNHAWPTLDLPFQDIRAVQILVAIH